MKPAVILGLGNPGKEYESTRHNLGFMALDQLREAMRFPDFTLNKYNKSLQTKGTWMGNPVILLKPQTFMNLSGESMIRLLKDYTPEQFLILYDDFDLPFNDLRIRASGSAGSHNGMKSIIGICGTPNIPRIRLGIKPDHPIGNAAGFVLSRFTKDEMVILEQDFLPQVVSAVKSIMRLDIQKAAGQFNRKAKSEKQKKENIPKDKENPKEETSVRTQ
jgi:PTH1 family peptidyl-tRNA hydrolase